MLLLSDVIRRHDISFHYVDDTWLYLPIKPTDLSMLGSLPDSEPDSLTDITKQDVIKFLSAQL